MLNNCRGRQYWIHILMCVYLRKRLVLDKEVRLRNAYVIKANEVIKDDNGEILEVHCTYDPETLGVNPEGRKVRGVIHWVSAERGVPAEVRLYDRLFMVPTPGKDGDYHKDINPESLQVLPNCVVEPSLADVAPGERFQFEREGYFCRDMEDAEGGKPVFNRIVSLRDSWGG